MAIVAALPWIGGGLFAGWSFFKEVKNALPHLEDEAVVTVWGQPGTTKKTLWRIAAASAFTMVRRWDFFQAIPPVSMIMTEYDAAANVVRFTIRYRTNLAGAPGAAFPNIRQLPIFAGPGENVVGASWNFIGGIPGMPHPLGALGVPDIGLDGKVILTTSPSIIDAGGGPIRTPNPRPSFDSRSKGTLANLVYTSLATPDESLYLSQTFPIPVFPESFSGS
jgi:hypothetical protein